MFSDLCHIQNAALFRWLEREIKAWGHSLKKQVTHTHTHTHTHQPLKLWLTTTARWQKRKLMKIVSHHHHQHQNTSHHQLSTWRTNRQRSLFPLKEGKWSLESAHQDKNHGLLAKLLLVQLLAKDLFVPAFTRTENTDDQCIQERSQQLLQNGNKAPVWF